MNRMQRTDRPVNDQFELSSKPLFTAVTSSGVSIATTSNLNLDSKRNRFYTGKVNRHQHNSSLWCWRQLVTDRCVESAFFVTFRFSLEVSTCYGYATRGHCCENRLLLFILAGVYDQSLCVRAGLSSRLLLETHTRLSKYTNYSWIASTDCV